MIQRLRAAGAPLSPIVNSPVFKLAAIGVMLIAAFLYTQPTTFWWLNIYDEGLIVYGAVRVMGGDLPYRDFWTQYSPGQFYVLAGLFRLFGATVMVERTWDVVCRAVLALALYGVAAQLTNRWLALVVWAAGVVWLAFYGFFGYPIFQGLLFSFLSIYFLLKAMSNPAQMKWRWWSGVMLGLAAIFRHDMAVYAVAAEGLVFIAFIATSQHVGNLFTRIWRGILGFLPVAAGALILVGPVLLVLVALVPLHELLDQLFIFPLVTFPLVRDLPYPTFTGSAEDLPFYMPFVIYLVAAAVAMVRALGMGSVRLELEHGLLRREQFTDAVLAHLRAQNWGVFVVVLFGLFGFNQARVRSDLIHTPHFFLASVVLLPVLVRGFRRVDAMSSGIVAVMGLVALYLLFPEPLDWHAERLKARRDSTIQMAMAMDNAQGTLADPNQIMVAKTVRNLTQPGDPVYIGLSRHDKVFANDAMLYFLAKVSSPTRYQELHPGLVNTEPVQAEMVADLERHTPKVIVLTNMFEGANEPNDTRLSSGVHLLDNYLKEHYQLSNVFGSYRILKRKI